MPTKSQSFTKKDFLEGLGDFFENVLAPYFEEHVDKRFDEHDKRFEKIEAQLDSMDRKLDLVTGKVMTHDKQLLTLRP